MSSEPFEFREYIHNRRFVIWDESQPTLTFLGHALNVLSRWRFIREIRRETGLRQVTLIKIARRGKHIIPI